MALLIFDCKGVPATRRERIEAAVEASGKHVAESYEGWIAADLAAECGWLLLAHRAFERTVLFALDEDPTVITHRVSETIDEWQDHR